MAWNKLATKSATSTVGNVTLDAFTLSKKFNFGILHQLSTASDLVHRFNGDTGNNYAHRFSQDGAADGTQVSRANWWNYNSGTDKDKFTVFYFINLANNEKIGISFGVQQINTGAASAPSRTEEVFKWANTSVQISYMDMDDLADNNTLSGSNITILGTD